MLGRDFEYSFGVIVWIYSWVILGSLSVFFGFCIS